MFLFLWASYQLSWQKGYLSHFHRPSLCRKMCVLAPLFTVPGWGYAKKLLLEPADLQRHLWYTFLFALQVLKCKRTPWWGLVRNDLASSWCALHDGQIECTLNVHQCCRPFPLDLAWSSVDSVCGIGCWTAEGVRDSNSCRHALVITVELLKM